MIRENTPSGPPETSKSPELEGKNRIRLLPDALVDQIAAGEVVERPASVVKELVENSLDAGAQRIRVEIREGGAALIAITDDGAGMAPEELALALQRHATSKLASAEDLERIASFGFRGEALPAIASVSRFRIFSRARGAEHGYEVRSEGGRLLEEKVAGGPEGTRIEVADLFSSVPARRKFLKRPGTEWSHISDWLARLALARPEIHIEIQRDDRKATVWPACDDPRDRIAALISDDDAAALLEVDHKTPECRVHAFLSTPERTRGNANALYLYVNGRPVRDRLVRNALTQAYRDLLPRGRFPIAVLFLEVPPETVDVNVHPAKWEVRFADPQAVHRAIRHAVREAMASRTWLTSAVPIEKGPRTVELRTGTAPVEVGGPSRYAPEMEAEGEGVRVDLETPSTASRHAPRAAATTDDWIFAGQPGAAATDAEALTDAERARDGGSAQIVAEGVRGGVHEAGPASASDAPVRSFGALRVLGQLRASYILAEGDDGLIVVDQHAAHERYLYENLRSAWLASGVLRQGLLTPETVSLPARSLAALEANVAAVSRLGFEVEPFGEGAVLVRALPAEMAGQDVVPLIKELASALEELGDAEEADDDNDAAIRWLPTLDRLFATMACHAARRFGDRLPAEEQQAILKGLDEIPWAPTCPHGRPVAISIDVYDLEARFKRR